MKSGNLKIGIKMKSFGRCFECERLMLLNLLEQIEFSEYHKIKNAYHHKLICVSCIKKAEELK